MALLARLRLAVLVSQVLPPERLLAAEEPQRAA